MSEFIRRIAAQFDPPPEPYGWIITKDHLFTSGDEINDAGRMGPADIDPSIADRLMHGEGREFRTLDGDGELYHSGRILTPNDEEGGGDEDWAPLHDYSRPGAGATDIEYYDKAKEAWVAL
ncbi:hypothetical protein [Streptomyces sp. NPDC017448]|uniref:hypothetical protein n=1 Tax=Streptomyces sp. NPDC017448 TaxID=3364996 RepID=UPI0037BD359C